MNPVPGSGSFRAPSFELLSRELKTEAPGGCAEGCVLPELQGYVLIIGTCRDIKGHFQKKNKPNGFSGLGEIWEFGGLDKNFRPNSGVGAAK